MKQWSWLREQRNNRRVMSDLVFALATGRAMMEWQFIFSYERYFLPKASFEEPTQQSWKSVREDSIVAILVRDGDPLPAKLPTVG